MGEVLYNRALITGMLNTETIRTAIRKFGQKPPSTEQARWGFENLDVTEQQLDHLGFKGMMRPLKVTCDNHEANGVARVQQWDGKQRATIADGVEPMREIVRSRIEEAAVEKAKKLGSMRDCTKAK